MRVTLKDFYVMGKALSGKLSCMQTGLVITKGGYIMTFVCFLEDEGSHPKIGTQSELGLCHDINSQSQFNYYDMDSYYNRSDKLQFEVQV